MAKRAYELLVRFGENESIAGAHVKEMHLDEDGKDLRETSPVPLADTENPVFEAFATKFAAKTVAENEVLKSEKATLLSEKATLTTEKATLESEKSSLESQLTAKTEQATELAADKTALTSQVSTLTSEKSALTAQVASLTSQVESLEAQLDAIQNPPGPDVTTREGLKQYLSLNRYEKEIAGFTVGGQLISTNRDELAHWFARFFDAFNHLNGNPSASGGVYPYKPRGGTAVVNLTAEQAVRAYQCLAWYVNACIATEGELITAIDGAQLSQLVDIKETIDTTSTWPQRTFEWVSS